MNEKCENKGSTFGSQLYFILFLKDFIDLLERESAQAQGGGETEEEEKGEADPPWSREPDARLLPWLQGA